MNGCGMIEIDDKYKQVLKYAVQAYYEDYFEMKKDKLEELEALEESLSEMRAIIALLGSPEKSQSEDTVISEETTPSVHLPQPVSMQQSGGEVLIAQNPNSRNTGVTGADILPEIPKKSEKEHIDSPGPDNYGMRPGDLKLMPFDYNKDNIQQYKTIFFQELSDGRVVIEYNNSHYYTSKVAVMQIPYPFPVGYFSKKNGWSSTVEQAFRTYRRYLAGEIPPKEPDAHKCITKEDLVVDWFECDPSQGKKIKGYENCKIVEMPDGRVMVQYKDATHYYTSKEKVMKIPYPVPKGFFKEAGLSSVAEVCIRAYRHYLEYSKGDGDVTSQEVTETETESLSSLPSRLQKLKELVTPSITKDDVLIDPFECDSAQRKEIKGYDNCSVVELLDGRAMVQYNRSYYYTEKQKVMKIRYPIPKGYFDGVGLSSNAEISIRAYRHYLATQTQTDQVPEAKEDEPPNEAPSNSDQSKEKPRLEFFKEDSGFDYASVAPQHIGGSTVYRSKAGKLVVKRQGKNNRGELLLTKDQDIEKLMNYDEKDVDWVIRSLSAEKHNILRGYLRDLKELKAVTG